MLAMLQKIGEVHFGLLGKNGCYLKAKKERVTAARSGCRHNLKYENFMSSFGRLRQKVCSQKACRTCSTIVFSFNFHSVTNQIIDLGVVVAVVISETPQCYYDDSSARRHNAAW